MLATTSVKEKKRVTSSYKHNRSNTVETARRTTKNDFKKSELIQLLARYEAQLQAKDIALTTLKSEKLRLLLLSTQSNPANVQANPYMTLFADSHYVKDNILSKQNPTKNLTEAQFLQLTAQHKKQVETLKQSLEVAEKRCLSLTQELEKEKRDKLRLQTSQNQLLIVEQEKSQLRNDLDNVKSHNKELEKQLIELVKLLEHEHERHKKFVILILNQRRLEREYHKEQLKQLTNHHINDESQREAKFKELELENERNKQVLTERITQLQNEIDLLVKEKKQQSTLNNSRSVNQETNESISKSKSKTDAHCPTIISTPSKPNGNLLTKTKVMPVSVSTATQPLSSPTNSTSPIPPITKRNAISIRPSTGNSPTLSSPIPTSTSTIKNNVFRIGGNPPVTKNIHQMNKSPASTKRINQTSFSSERKTDDIRALLETIHTVAENRVKSQTQSSDASNSDTTLFRSAETGHADQLLNLLKLGANPNSQTMDGNTCLHLSTINGHIDCIRHLLQFDANPYIENNLGITPWNNLSQLDESVKLACLREFVDHGHNLPPIDLVYNAIECNHINAYDYLLSLLQEQLKNDISSLTRLLRTTLRSSNTHFLECLFPIITIQDFTQLIDQNTFISSECLTVLSSLENEEAQSNPINLTICIASSTHERHYSYAIGKISVTSNMSWLELERSCSKIYLDHIVQLDSAFDYDKLSMGCSTNNIHTLILGATKWHYQDSPNDDSFTPYTVAREQNIITIHLKGIDINATDSLAYNYFVPSQSLKQFIRHIEQNVYVGVYGAPYLQKKFLFEDLMRYLERPVAFSTSPKFKVIRFAFESITSLDDCIDELVEQDFLRTNPWPTNTSDQHYSSKFLLYFANVHNQSGGEMIHLLLNSQSVSDTCHKFLYSTEDEPNSTITYYFPTNFHIFVTLSKRTSPTENEIYKKFKWIPFKIDNPPWNGLLKRHLWRRMIDMNIRENRSTDHELMKTLQWITNIWQRYNESLSKQSLHDAVLGPALFFDCPMERDAIFEWLQTKWNTIIGPLVRDYSMTKFSPTKSKDSMLSTTMTGSSLRRNSIESNASNESGACTALYVLLQRAVSRDCPLTGDEREGYLLNFVGSRVEGGSSSSPMIYSQTPSRAGTPQSLNNSDFISIQLE